MKKFLLTFLTFATFVGSVWGEDNCYLVNDPDGFDWFMDGEHIYKFSAPASTFSIDVKKSMNTAVGSIHFYTSSDNNNWSELAELGAGSLNKKSYTNFKYSIDDENVRYIKIKFSGSYTRYIRNAKVTQKKYLKVTEPSSKSLSFGSVVYGTTSGDQSITVGYSSTAANVSTSNPAFIVSTTSVGNSSCGVSGTQSVTVTFKPTSVGVQSGTITIGSNTVSVSGTGTLAAPAELNASANYTSLLLGWPAVAGAEKYIVTCGNESQEVVATNAMFENLELGANYNCSVKAVANGTESAAVEVNVTTKDLSASASFTVGDVSYTSVVGSWAKIADATGYMLVASNGAVTVFDGADTTSGDITGLMPNSSYTFTVYGMYGDAVSPSGTQSGAINTLKTNCPVQIIENIKEGSMGQGFNWGFSTEFELDRNYPILSFSYSALSSAVTWKGKLYTLYEYVDGEWKKVWESNNKSGSVANLQLSRETRRVKVEFTGNFGFKLNGISVMQGIYLEVQPTALDFGSVKVGESVEAKTVTVNYSTMMGDVTSSSDRFSTSKDIIGADDCGYGADTFTVGVNTVVNAGTYKANIMVGSQKIDANVVVVALDAPEVVANVVEGDVIVSWSAVEGANGYKVECAKAGISEVVSDLSYTASGLADDNEYEFVVTTMYDNIENGSASASAYVPTSGVAMTDDGKMFQTLEEAVVYSKDKAVKITLLADREDEELIVTDGAKITIDGQGHKIGNVLVEENASLVVAGTIIAGDLNIKTAYRSSGEVYPISNLEVTGKVSFDKVLDPKGAINSNMWYAVCVPFPVSVSDIVGIDASGNEHSMVFDKDYIVSEYDGNARARTGKGWVDLKASSVMVPGKMYIVAAIRYNEWRFYKQADAPLISDLTTITLEAYESSNVKNQGWNAIGNSQIYHVDLNTEIMFGQVLKNGSNAYEIVSLSDESFAVASPLFVQYMGGSSSVDLTKRTNGSLRSVSADNSMFNIRIAAAGSDEYADQLFLSASDGASADYVIGKDVAKMGSVTGVDVARIWMNAKDSKLAVMDAKLSDGSVIIPLGVSAPQAGKYNLYLNKVANGLELELMYNGQVVHNFADGNYNIALSRGENSGYSLRVSENEYSIETASEEVDGIVSYINEGVLYISGLNDGDEYSVFNVAGLIAKGKADGNVVSMQLPTKGLYIVFCGKNSVKLLNK